MVSKGKRHYFILRILITYEHFIVIHISEPKYVNNAFASDLFVIKMVTKTWAKVKNLRQQKVKTKEQYSNKNNNNPKENNSLWKGILNTYLILGAY